jgi:ribonuclease G
MQKDRARHNILPMSKFGLVQLTRERVRPAIEIATSELCSTCMGTGRVDSSVQLIGKIENEITYLWENMNQKGITLRANALITHYFKAGLPSIRMKWFLKHKRWLHLETDPNLPITGYELINAANQIINNSL